MKGVSQTTPEGHEFAIRVMNYLKDRTTKWRNESGLGFSLYGTPAESLCYRFARIAGRTTQGKAHFGKALSNLLSVKVMMTLIETCKASNETSLNGITIENSDIKPYELRVNNGEIIPKIASIVVGEDGGYIFYINSQEKVAFCMQKMDIRELPTTHS